MLDALMNFADQICMTVVGAGKALVDVYGGIVYGITGAIRNFGKPMAAGGMIAMGGMVAGSWGATAQPQGQPLGQAWTSPTQQPSWSAQPQQQPVSGSLPVATQGLTFTTKAGVSITIQING